MMSTSIRTLLANVSAALPDFKGKGRLVLAFDRMLTDPSAECSYLVEREINRSHRMRLDLRGWEQKFAYYYGEHDRRFIDLVKTHFERGAFFDVGASIGHYAASLGQLCRERGSKLVAFEPVPENVSRLKENVALNGLQSTVEVLNTAVGLEAGHVRMSLTEPLAGPGNAKIRPDGEVEVPVSTLDALWKQLGELPVGFVKIDTEGWDADIIMGSQELLRECRPRIFAEFNRERMRNNHKPLLPCWRFLTEELHYQCYRLAGRTLERLTDPGEHENLLFLEQTELSA
jgi:FkbM family methyltransferase